MKVAKAQNIVGETTFWANTFRTRGARGRPENTNPWHTVKAGGPERLGRGGRS